MEPPDSHHVAAAEGWLELGNVREAANELARTRPENRNHPTVLQLQWEIHSRNQQWEECVEWGRALAEAAPRLLSGWIHWAYALHELKQTAEARRVLLEQAGNFPKEHLLRYNLACYAAQLGDMEAAWSDLQAAIGLGDAAEIKSCALRDPDLEPLWDRIRWLEA